MIGRYLRPHAIDDYNPRRNPRKAERLERHAAKMREANQENIRRREAMRAVWRTRKESEDTAA